MRHAVAACLLAMIAATGAEAATRTWQGDVDQNWSTAGNWAENVAPVDGDDLVFPDSPTSRTSNNDLVSLTLASVLVTTTDTGADYNFTGNGIGVTGPVTFNNNGVGGPSTTHWQIIVTVGAPITLTTTGRLTSFEGNISLGVNTLTLAVGGDLTISGIIAGAGAITKNGVATLALTNTNSYAGATQVNGGTLRTESAGALGNSATGTTFASGTQLHVTSGPYTLPEPLTFSGPAGTVVMGSGNNVLSGALGFTGTLTFQMDVSGGLSGAITSAGTLVVTGPGALSTAGDSPAFTGIVDIQSGGFIPQSAFPAAINLQAPGSLFGTATSGLLTMTGGTFAPGIVQQFFAPAGLASSGGLHNLVMVPGAPVTNYDQIQVTGAVSLGGTTLNTTAAGVLPLGLTFVIILNDGADPVVGTYAGKPEGATYFQANNWFTITYVGGDGNDVVLTTVAAPAPSPSVPVPGPGPLALALAVVAIIVLARRRSMR
jgi:autotransporter-associated beta strand protein